MVQKVAPGPSPLWDAPISGKAWLTELPVLGTLILDDSVLAPEAVSSQRSYSAKETPWTDTSTTKPGIGQRERFE
jgi:hypothetical protein